MLVRADGSEVALEDVDVAYEGSVLTLRMDPRAAGAKADDMLEVRYEARIEKACPKTGAENPYANTVRMEHPCDPADAEKRDWTEKVDVELITWAVRVKKVDAEDGSALSGAVFALREKDTGRVLAKDGSWRAAYEAASCDFVTDKVGCASFRGIDEGVYEIVEVSAPEGYALYEGLIELTLGSDLKTGKITAQIAASEGATLSAADAAAGTVELEVENAKKPTPDPEPEPAPAPEPQPTPAPEPQPDPKPEDEPTPSPSTPANPISPSTPKNPDPFSRAGTAPAPTTGDDAQMASIIAAAVSAIVLFGVAAAIKRKGQGR